jgi:hypothetical protein
VLLTVSFGSSLIPFLTDVEDNDYETEDNQFDENQPITLHQYIPVFYYVIPLLTLS